MGKPSKGLGGGETIMGLDPGLDPAISRNI